MRKMNMNISCRITNADTQCGRITNPPERRINVHSVGHIQNKNGQYLYPLIYDLSEQIKRNQKIPRNN